MLVLVVDVRTYLIKFKFQTQKLESVEYSVIEHCIIANIYFSVVGGKGGFLYDSLHALPVVLVLQLDF